MSETTEHDLKMAYASMLIGELDPYKAAFSLLPDDPGKALWIGKNWPDDPEVKAEKKKLEDGGAKLNALPDDADLLRETWSRMQNCDMADFIKAGELYAKIRGYIKKENPTVNNTVVMPKVMKVPAFNSDDQWEKAASQQQSELLNVSRTRH